MLDGPANNRHGFGSPTKHRRTNRAPRTRFFCLNGEPCGKASRLAGSCVPVYQPARFAPPFGSEEAETQQNTGALTMSIKTSTHPGMSDLERESEIISKLHGFDSYVALHALVDLLNPLEG